MHVYIYMYIYIYTLYSIFMEKVDIIYIYLYIYILMWQPWTSKVTPEHARDSHAFLVAMELVANDAPSTDALTPKQRLFDQNSWKQLSHKMDIHEQPMKKPKATSKHSKPHATTSSSEQITWGMVSATAAGSILKGELVTDEQCGIQKAEPPNLHIDHTHHSTAFRQMFRIPTIAKASNEDDSFVKEALQENTSASIVETNITAHTSKQDDSQKDNGPEAGIEAEQSHQDDDQHANDSFVKEALQENNDASIVETDITADTSKQDDSHKDNGPEAEIAAEQSHQDDDQHANDSFVKEALQENNDASIVETDITADTSKQDDSQKDNGPEAGIEAEQSHQDDDQHANDSFVKEGLQELDTSTLLDQHDQVKKEKDNHDNDVSNGLTDVQAPSDTTLPQATQLEQILRGLLSGSAPKNTNDLATMLADAADVLRNQQDTQSHASTWRRNKHTKKEPRSTKSEPMSPGSLKRNVPQNGGIIDIDSLPSPFDRTKKELRSTKCEPKSPVSSKRKQKCIGSIDIDSSPSPPKRLKNSESKFVGQTMPSTSITAPHCAPHESGGDQQLADQDQRLADRLKTITSRGSNRPTKQQKLHPGDKEENSEEIHAVVPPVEDPDHPEHHAVVMADASNIPDADNGDINDVKCLMLKPPHFEILHSSKYTVQTHNVKQVPCQINIILSKDNGASSSHAATCKLAVHMYI